MKKGLVLGKFMPLHKGHIALIHFSLAHCDHLTVLLCHHPNEPISGKQRLLWLNELYGNNTVVSVVSYQYNPALLANSSEPNDEYAKAWAESIQKILHPVDVFFSSEEYGDNLAKYLEAEHQLFDKGRTIIPVAASLIRKRPFTYWDFLPPPVRPYFVKKIALVGSESTGKSTLTQNLAKHYQTAFVPEMAREIIEHTESCTYEHLHQIAALHATTILSKTKEANKVLFCDTDINITKSYAAFLFDKDLVVPQWIENANRCDLYLFLETDCEYVQDGTRLSKKEREKLSEAHKAQLKKAGIQYTVITGHWLERFEQACQSIDKFINSL